jgi:hypothetical protein
LKLFRFSKRENEHECCLAIWTPWLTVVWDFGSVQCRGTDEFELVIKYRAWGPIFYWGNRDIEKLGERSKFDRLQFTKIQPRYAEQRKRRIDDRDYYERKEQLVREGKRKSPADMTYFERHAATMGAVKKMKFSAEFVHLMTTPVAKLALERGEVVEDIDFDGTHTGKFLTQELFEDDKKKYVPVGLPSGGILGFKKAESGEGYEAISVPGAELRQVASGKVDRPQLETEK